MAVYNPATGGASFNPRGNARSGYASRKNPWDTEDPYPWKALGDESGGGDFLGGGGIGGAAQYQGPNVTPGGISTRPTPNARRAQRAGYGSINDLMLGTGTYKPSAGFGGAGGNNGLVNQIQALYTQQEGEAGGAFGADQEQINVLDEWKANLPWLQGTATNIAEDQTRRAAGNASAASQAHLARSGMLGSGVSAGVARRQQENLAIRLQRARDLAKMSVTMPYLGAVERQADRQYAQRPRITSAATPSLAGGNAGTRAVYNQGGGWNIAGNRKYW